MTPDALIGLHREYGIRTFKIDGVMIPDKRADLNLRRMFERVMDATGGQVVFSLDVTAGRRWGYHYGNEYGNIFLENRYHDWSNHYLLDAAQPVDVSRATCRRRPSRSSS